MAMGKEQRRWCCFESIDTSMYCWLCNDLEADVCWVLRIAFHVSLEYCVYNKTKGDNADGNEEHMRKDPT